MIPAPVPSVGEWEQRIVFYTASDEAMSISAYENGIYIQTAGQEYALSAPPWLFEMLIEATANTVIVPFNKAVAVAKRWVVGTDYEEYITEQSFISGNLERYDDRALFWVLIFNTKEEGMQRVKIDVLFYWFYGVSKIE